MLFSDSWYRVKGLRPLLRQHARIYHHVYRGQNWHVLQDISTGRYHRFSAEAYFIIGLMDGQRSLDEIWNLACERLGDNMPTQEEVIGLLGQLHRADALMMDIPPDIAELIERRDQQRRMRFWGQLRSPMSIKIPLFDPERFLNRTFPLVQPLFGWFGLVMWGFLTIWALTLLGPNWTALTADVADRVFSLENLTLIGFLYPVVKIIHEFGHAYAVKRWGGEVHEMGVMFLVLMPVPYVDASASLAYSNKYQRMLVAAAGILVELLLASLALIAWSHMEAGPARSVVYNVLLICGVSTLLFNGNPLLRFDAYYVFSDFLEIPNLGARGNRYLAYLFQKVVLGVKGLISPAHTPGEARWLGGYALAAFVYRIFISVRIILFVAGKFFSSASSWPFTRRPAWSCRHWSRSSKTGLTIRRCRRAGREPCCSVASPPGFSSSCWWSGLVHPLPWSAEWSGCRRMHTCLPGLTVLCKRCWLPREPPSRSVCR